MLPTVRAILDALARGEAPEISLSYAEHLVRPAKKTRERVPKKPVFALYVSKPVAFSSSRRRCWNPYCKKRLLTNQQFVCGAGCHTMAVEHLTAALTLLEGKAIPVTDPKEVPDVTRYGHINESGFTRVPKGRRPAAVSARKDRR